MRIWSVVSQKGGSGKTTLLVHLATAASAKGLAVSVIDLDPQRSAEQWAELREDKLRKDEPAVVHGDTLSLDGMLAAARETGTDLVLIDTPPAIDKSMIYAAAAADVVLLPTRTAYFDRLALAETLDYLKRIGALSKTLVIVNAPLKDEAARAEVNRIASTNYGVTVLAHTLDENAALAKSLESGKGIVEAQPKGKPARALLEIYKTISEIDAAKAASNTRRSA
ncbi:MAG: AAA family ATPase [Hyphomicrobiaceae bacterium]